MKILLYGSGPYRQYKDNISEKIVKLIKQRKGLVKKIFPVKFDKQQFINQIKKTKPDVIIGLGQCSKCRKIKIERRAQNFKRNNKDEKQKVILKGGPKYLYTSLKLKKDNNSRISYDAGDYVCNFSMYIILNYVKDKNIRFGYIHIPRNYDLNKAAIFVENKIKEIKDGKEK